MIDIDPFDPQVLRNPYPFHETLREAGPIVWLSAHGTYGVGRYDVVNAVLADWRNFSSAAGASLSDIRKPGSWRVAGPIVEVDPPAHTQTRKTLQQIISPKVVRGWRDLFAQEAETLCERLLEDRLEFDAVPSLVEAYVLKVFPESLGIAVERDNLITVGNHNFQSLGPQNELFKKSQAAVEQISGWFERSQQREAMIAGGFGESIFEAEDRGDFAPGTASPLLRTLLRGGMDTTISGIGTTLRLLAENPDQWALVQDEPGLVKFAFEEAIRLESPAQTFFRTTRPQGAEFQGHRLAGDTKVQLFPSAANRDPRQWREPDRFDLRRERAMHTAFGAGIHNCVGQMISRLEAECLLTSFVRRVRHVELVGEPRLRPNNSLRTLDTLPLRVSLKR